MNARMMRAKMALEIVTELYAERMSHLGNAITISLKAGSDEPQFEPLRVGMNGDLLGGMRAPIEVGHKRVDVACVNPSAVVTMAFRGKGFFKEKMPLRALGVLPSWDRIAIAVSKDLKVRSLRDIARRKIPLRISTRPSGVDNTTAYTLSRILSFYGLSFNRIKSWGGEVEECAWPSSSKRKNSIRRRTVDAIFDEGIKTWLDDALENGYELLHLDTNVIREMERLGYRGEVIPRSRFRRLKEDIRTIDFSGWPLITHRWMSNETVYSICKAMDARRGHIPVDDHGLLNMKRLSRNTESGPLGIPLHPGARRYYRERGYL